MITFADLMFTMNDDVTIILYNNETQEMIGHPMIASDMDYHIDKYGDCIVMDIHTFVEFGIACICICIEV